LVVAVLAGCGGGGEKKPEPTQVVRGPGFAVQVPQGWRVTRGTRVISAAPSAGGTQLVQVLYFRLGKVYKPALFPKIVREIDAVAKQLAKQLKGTVGAGKTVSVGGLRGRQYDIAFEKDGAALRERITFLLRAPRREFELLCQWAEADGEPEACGLLTASFRPA
jgi:hypothetical protein